MELIFPSRCLIAAVGPSGIGKTTFFRRRLPNHMVLSSDDFRYRLCGDANSQDFKVTRKAFENLYTLARERMELGQSSVIDSLGLKSKDRRVAIKLARELGVEIHAVVFTGDAGLARAGQMARGERIMPPGVDARMQAQMFETLRVIEDDGYDSVTILDRAQANAVKSIRFGAGDNAGQPNPPYDIIGDVHGCLDELKQLLGKLGYREDAGRGCWAHPLRTAVFVGDLTDRGPHNLDTFRFVADMLAGEAAVMVRGNHDDKLMRWAKGSKVQVSHGMEKTVAEWEKLGRSNPEAASALREQILSVIGDAPYQRVLDEGRLVVVHAGLKPHMVGRSDTGKKKGPVASMCLYGEVAGTGEDGLPIRLDFTRDWDSDATLVYGHQVFDEVRVSGPNSNCYGIDTGSAFGGYLTALRYPEMELVSVPAQENYDLG